LTFLIHPQKLSGGSIGHNSKSAELEIGLDFILGHFDPNGRVSLFPRTIMTKKLRYQKEVFSKGEALEYFTDSNYLDCRINSFPSYTEYKGVQRYPPNFIFIDLDKKENNLKLALSNTLKNIETVLGGHPTVLQSGNGFHIIQPVECPKILVDGVLEPAMLENIKVFKSYDKPSQDFLRFTKDYLSDGKVDLSHNPSFNSCLLRIPGSINSKNMQQVTIIRKWNGVRSPLTIELMEEFRSHLLQKKIEVENIRQKNLELRNSKNNNFNNNCYDWIDKLVLNNPFSDYRKLIVGLILAPYLIVIKKLSNDQSYQIINKWLQKCDSIRRLDFEPKYLINNNLKVTGKKQIPPMFIYKLKTNYRNLYFLIDKKNNNEIISLSNQTEREDF
jgi:hypothetical protein